MNRDINELKKEFSKIQSTIRNGARLKHCLHPEKGNCKLPIIDAHSLQRQGALKILEHTINKNRFLYAFTEREHNSTYDFLDLKKIGRGSASTFNGFCSFHDTELFKIIENDPEITDIESDEHCFLHSYRSFSHSYHRKHEELNLYETDDEHVKEVLIKLHRIDGLEFIKGGVKAGCKDFEEPKSILDHYLVEHNFSELEYLVFEYNYTIPIACAGSVSPTFFPNGELFNCSMDSDVKYQNILTTVLPFKNRSIIILSALPQDKLAVKYLDMIDSIRNKDLQQKAISFHIISGSENVFLSPKYYDRKTMKWKKEFCKLLDQSSNPYKLPITKNKDFSYNFFSPTDALVSYS